MSWRDLDKASFVAAVGLGLSVLFAVWTGLTLRYTEFGQHYFDAGYARLLIAAELVCSSFWVLILMMAAFLRRRRQDPLWFSQLVLSAYFVLLVPAGWIYGWLSLPAGMILVGSYMAGMVLCDLRLARLPVVLSLVLFALIIFLTLSGEIPYAPLFKVHPLGADTPSTYFFVSELLLSLPFGSMSALTGLMMIIKWREREASIRRLSMTDELTGIANRRAILNSLEHELARSQRNQKPVNLAILDLDHFKQVNDNHGHDAGDLVLKAAAQRLQESIRSSDWLGRFGGEEFLLVMPETNADEAMVVLERCRRVIAETPVTLATGNALNISASFGVCATHGSNLTAEALLRYADQAL